MRSRIILSVVLLVLAGAGRAQESAPAAQEGAAGTRAFGILFLAINVADLDRSLDFYTRALGMKETGRYPEGKGGVGVALKLTDRPEEPHLLLVHRKGVDAPLDLGDGFSRVALLVQDVGALVERVGKAGFKVSRAPVALPEHRVTVAFVTDPDGYAVELIQRN